VLDGYRAAPCTSPPTANATRCRATERCVANSGTTGYVLFEEPFASTPSGKRTKKSVLVVRVGCTRVGSLEASNEGGGQGGEDVGDVAVADVCGVMSDEVAQGMSSVP
jgi:hypothetical protein